MTVTSPRLPVEPLLGLSGMSLRALAELVGRETSAIDRDRRLGGFTPTMADRMATAIHLTPGYVWGDAWYQLPDGACGPVEHLTETQRARRDRHREQNRVNHAKQREASAA